VGFHLVQSKNLVNRNDGLEDGHGQLEGKVAEIEKACIDHKPLDHAE